MPRSKTQKRRDAHTRKALDLLMLRTLRKASIYTNTGALVLGSDSVTRLAHLEAARRECK